MWRIATKRSTPRAVLLIPFLLVLATALGPACGAARAMLAQLSPEQLTDKARSVLVATVTATGSRWTQPAGGGSAQATIVTDVRLSVSQVLKGSATPATTITVPGGTVGDYSMPIPDAPRFVPGLSYVVFLDARGQVVAWEEGQPCLVDGQLPALGLSLAQLKTRVAARVAAETGAARSAETVQAALASVLATTGTAVADVADGVSAAGAASLPGGAAGGAGTTRALPRALSTLLFDDFASGSLSAWEVRAPDPPSAGARRWGADRWVTGDDMTYRWAYSGEQVWSDSDGTGAWVTQGARSGTYAAGDETWIVRGPYDLSATPYAVLDFDLWLQTAGAGDFVGALVSGDGVTFEGPRWSGTVGRYGDQPYFVHKSLDLRAVPYDDGGHSHNYCGRPRVWVAFRFHAGTDAQAPGRGACIDNVRLRAGTSRIPIVAGISPGSAPAGTYLVPARDRSRVTISGSGFGAARGSVRFFYRLNRSYAAARIVSWSDARIVCEVPVATIDGYAASAGSGPVLVTTGGGVQAPTSLDVSFGYNGSEWAAARGLYRTNMSAARAAAVWAAAGEWNRAGSIFRFVPIGSSTTHPEGSGDATTMPLDGYNDICFAALPWDGVIATAWPRAYKGRIYECDLVFNTAGVAWGDGSGGTMDVQTVAAHELGHWLALRDLYGADREKTMYGFGRPGLIKHSLNFGDVAGVRWAYADNSLDTASPSTIAYGASIYAGRAATLRFLVNDPHPSIAAANVTCYLRNPAGAIVLKTSRRVATNLVRSWTFTCRLRRGVYQFVVNATDAAGHRQIRRTIGTVRVY